MIINLVYPILYQSIKSIPNFCIQYKHIYRNKATKTMSIFLGKYKNKKKLGKGAYGDVLLVEDPNGKEFALKMISKKILEKDPFMEEYLDGEKDCMMSFKSRYIMQLHDFEQDENYKYFVCEYCDGGDLLNYQAKQPNKVFTLAKASKILSEVIHGLQQLHQKGYLHRDIKPQNILLKKTGEQDDYHYKLADFGFSKKNQDVGGTVLGTQNYMSPEIYLNQPYSYEVDMWAFGVVFYFMLNLQFPFKINPHCKDMDQKRDDLIKLSKSFNYSEAVQKSKKKITDNCTKEVEDLFRKMFTPDGNERITFSEIRAHPVFKEHFPVISDQSKILYKKTKNKPMNRLDSFIIAKKSGFQKPPAKKVQQQQNIQPSIIVKKSKAVQFDKQKLFIQLEFDKIKYLADSQQQIINSSGVLEASEILMIRYCFLKYYIILLRQFSDSLKPQILQKKKPQLKWKQFCKDMQFKKLRKQYQNQLHKAQLRLTQVYDSCDIRLNEIKKINPSFEKIYESQVTDKQFSGNFKEAYRASTGLAYAKLRKVFQNGNKFVYLTAMVTICHAFNKIVEADEKQLSILFKNFLQKQDEQKQIDFGELRGWMSRAQKDSLKPIITEIFKMYFS